MTRFYLHEKARLDKALQLLIAAMEKYNARDFDADVALMTAFDEGIGIYKELGKSNQESRLQALKAEWVTAQRGINPVTLEKVSIRRNEMVNTIKFSVMQKMQQQLSEDTGEAEAILKEASVLISQIIIAALQAQLITERDIEMAGTEEEKEALWITAGKDNNISLGQKRVLLLISRFDALLIFGDLLQQLITRQ
jgi:hypothetical protein